MSAPANQSMPSIRLERFNVCLGSRLIIENINTAFFPGEFVVLLGPNGAGKSTLLKSIAGIAPGTGRADIFGASIRSCSNAKRARQISYLQQGGDICWPMPVREIVALGRLPFGASANKIHPDDLLVIESAMRDCDIFHLASRPSTELSGGERMRVLLARLLAVQAPIILADEPIASLDPSHQLTTMNLLREEATKGRTVIAVIHDVNLAFRFASRIIALSDGRILADDTPEDLLDSNALASVFNIDFEMVRSASGQRAIVAI